METHAKLFLKTRSTGLKSDRCGMETFRIFPAFDFRCQLKSDRCGMETVEDGTVRLVKELKSDRCGMETLIEFL